MQQYHWQHGAGRAGRFGPEEHDVARLGVHSVHKTEVHAAVDEVRGDPGAWGRGGRARW